MASRHPGRSWHSPKLECCAEEFWSHLTQENEVAHLKPGNQSTHRTGLWYVADPRLLCYWLFCVQYLTGSSNVDWKSSLACSSCELEGEPKPRDTTKMLKLDLGEDLPVSPWYPALCESLSFSFWKELGAKISTEVPVDLLWPWINHEL